MTKELQKAHDELQDNLRNWPERKFVDINASLDRAIGAGARKIFDLAQREREKLNYADIDLCLPEQNI